MNFVSARHDTYPYINPSNFNLQGKHVLITGASKGVGKAAALSYAKAGASCIALAARSDLSSVIDEIKTAAQTAGHPAPTVLPISLDVTSRYSVSAAAQSISAAFDARIDILINNAGYLSTFAGIPDSDPDEWWKDFEVNVKGTYLVTRAFFPLLLRSETKIIINVSSIGALMMPPHGSSYVASKLAVIRLTEQIHQDHGPGKDGICAIVLHPGAISTELSRGMPEKLHGYLVDTPELAGDTMCWLGAERREWLAGRYVSASWDLEELSVRKEEVLRGELLRARLAVNGFGE